MKRKIIIAEAFLPELLHNAKLNKPSNAWKTSEWDRMVDLVSEAMKKPPPDVPGDAA